MQSYANYEWFLEQDLTIYAGKWLAIIDRKIVANNKDVAKVIKEVKTKYPNKRPLITKVKDKLSIL